MSFRDFVHALRSLRKSAAFSLTAVITIALGIGAATTIFSVTHAVLLRPLPYKDPDKLVFGIHDMRRRSVRDFPMSDADFIDVRNGMSGVFEDIAGVSSGRFTAPKQDGTLERLRLAIVTPNFFHMMGCRMAAGRDFNDADGQAPPPPPANPAAGAAPVGPALATVLSYDYFQRRFGGDTSILGHDMPGTQQPGTRIIVGVLAPGCELLFSADTNEERLPDTWFCARLRYDAGTRMNVQWRAVARLSRGISLERAQSAADRISAQIRQSDVIENTSGFALRLEPMHRHVVEAVRPALLALIGAVVFLLLIACANVANLMLVRAWLREREMAVRTALGGGWWRLARVTLAEALLLAFAGAAGGLGLATAGLSELRNIAPEDLPRLDSITIDPVVVMFAALAALMAAAIFGLAPAWRASRPDVAQVLRAGGRTAGLGGGGLMRSSVVVVEVALCFVLLIGSGLMFRSFLALGRIQPGFDSHGLLTFQLLGNRGLQQPQQRAAFEREVHDRLGSIPGVQAVAGCFAIPLAGGFSPIRWGLESALTDPSQFKAVDFEAVLPGYFEAMKTPLLAGRTFTDADNAPERNGVVVDEFLANKAFPQQNAVGKRILARIRGPKPEWVEILGVVAHVRELSLADPGREQIYFTDGYLNYGFAGSWAVRTSGDPVRLVGPVRAEIAKLGPKVLLNEMQPMDTLVEKAQSGTRFSLLLIGVFATVAALLAGVGLYGVLATVVRQRTAEIGVRMALGAAPTRIFAQVVGQGLRLSALGIVIGLVAAFALTRAISTLLVGVSRTDPVTFIAMSLVFLAVAAVASWVPAFRAAGLDPSNALRSE
jgi:putative ABC transport system permease protein